MALRAAFAAANNGRRITRALLHDAVEAETPLSIEKPFMGFRVAV